MRGAWEICAQGVGLRSSSSRVTAGQTRYANNPPGEVSRHPGRLNLTQGAHHNGVMTRYRTIDLELGNHAESEIVVQRSRFLARACRIEDEQSARQFIADIRALDHDAHHHCTAFVLGEDSAVRRSNDDSEPSGTAGRPILDAISGRELSDVVVVVTRWFGGTLLGTGGLTRAYGDATAAVLDKVGVRERERWHQVLIRAPHSDAGVLEHRLRQTGQMVGVDYGSEVKFTVAVRDLSVLARVDFEPIGTIWQDA